MAFNLSNVYAVSDTFESWITKTNYGLDIISTLAVTTAPNTAGGQTSGNAYVNGIFSANTLTATESIRGGNVTTSATLTCTSNIDVRGTYLNVISTNANVVIGGTGKTMNVSIPTSVTANVSIANAANVFIASTNTNIEATHLGIVADFAVWNIAGTGTKLFNVASTTNTASFAVETLNAVANSITSNAVTRFAVNAGNVALFSSNTTIGNSSVFGLRVTNDGVGTTSTVAGNTLNISANVNITGSRANVASVTFNMSNTTIGGSGNVIIASAFAEVQSNVYSTSANTTFANTVNLNGDVFYTQDFLQVAVANGDIGTGTSAAVNVYSFTKSSYSAAEVTAVAKNVAAGTQIVKMLVAHNGGTNVYITSYGTVAAPNTANVGIFSAVVTGGVVNLRFKQTVDNSSVKLLVNLIK